MRRIAAMVICLLAAVGCSSDPGLPAADDPIFAGLDRAVAAEVLTSKVALAKLNGESEAGAKSLLQGMTWNFMECRSKLAAYQQWVSTGTAPEMPPAITPQNPFDNVATDYALSRKEFERTLAGGDVGVLRSSLLSQSGCGAWIPAKPGDQTGPTIADVVRQG